jgi:hypothetical protein
LRLRYKLKTDNVVGPAPAARRWGFWALASQYPLAYRRSHAFEIKTGWPLICRCQTEEFLGAVRRRGAEEAGAVFVKVAHLDGNATRTARTANRL